MAEGKKGTAKSPDKASEEVKAATGTPDSEAEAAAKAAEGDNVAEPDEGGKRRSASSRERQRYAHERLIRESRELLDEEPHVVAGALVGQDDPLTRDAATKAVEKFLAREVKSSAQAAAEED